MFSRYCFIKKKCKFAKSKKKKLSRLKLTQLDYKKDTFKFNMGRYLDLNKELTVPHTAVLPIELYLPYF